MVRRGHVPQRMCAGCGQRSAARDLVRFVAVGRGGRVVVVLDSAATGSGRGVWLCASETCLDVALKRDVLRRRLHADDIAESLRQDFIEHITDTDSTDG